MAKERREKKNEDISGMLNVGVIKRVLGIPGVPPGRCLGPLFFIISLKMCILGYCEIIHVSFVRSM